MIAIKDNVMAVQQNIREIAQKCGRNPEEINLIAVSKNFGTAEIKEAVAAGVTMLGENRVQEVMEKYDELGQIAQWHLIGHLQTNKVKYVVRILDWIHSLDRMPLAQEISRRATDLGKVINVLVQVNIAEEESKFGLTKEETPEFIKEVALLPGLKIRGLMTIAPYVENPEEVRWVFRELRLLRDSISVQAIKNVSMEYLSMGMSGDYGVAIEEGSNMVRIGSAIFGNRVYT